MSTQHDRTAEADELTKLDVEGPKLPLAQRGQIALMLGTALLLAALQTKTGRALLLLAAAGLIGCATWLLIAY